MTDDLDDKTTIPNRSGVSLAVDIACVMVAAVLASALGALAGLLFNYAAISATAFAFLAILLFGAWGFGVVRQNHAIAYERLGKLHVIRNRGAYWYNPFLDREVFNQTLSEFEIQLYADCNEEDKFDFRDASTPADVRLWGSIGEPTALANCDWERVNLDISRYIYTAVKPITRVISLCDSALRPKLQAFTLEEAQSTALAEQACDVTIQEITPALKAVGFYPSISKTHALLVKDIVQPQSVIDARELALKGTMEAAAAKARFQSMALAIEGIMELGVRSGHPVSYKDAADQARLQLTFETLAKTGSNLTIIAPGVDGVVKALDINQARK